MKIIFLSFSDMVTNGTATRIIQLARETAGDVRLIFDGHHRGDTASLRPLRISFTPKILNKPLTLGVGIIYKTIWCLRQKPDIIHCFKPLPTSYIPALVAAKLTGARLVLDFDDLEDGHGLARRDPRLWRGLLTWFQNRALAQAPVVVAATQALAQVARRFRTEVKVVENGVTVRPDVETGSMASGAENRAVSALYVGSLYKTSDLDLALEAMTYCPGIKLVVAGDGPLKGMYQDLAVKLGLGSRVEFLGAVPWPRIPDLIRTATVGLLPMRDNRANQCRSPVKLGEYMAAGLPVVASPVGIVPDWISHGHNGLLADTPQEMGQAVARICEDARLARSLGRMARESVEQAHLWRLSGEQLNRLYGSLR
ncbi:MAG: glycosyltransferase family 4 protein [Deltaproteobacteria bacterium]|nr:glycosyltransferase family 4 protein [Deltaproteobacteria bacterium]